MSQKVKEGMKNKLMLMAQKTGKFMNMKSRMLNFKISPTFYVSK